MSPKFLWRVAVGTKGSRVSAIERTPDHFYLRYWMRGDGSEKGRWKMEAIPATSQTDAEAAALAMSRALLLAEPTAPDAAVTVGTIIARYTDEQSAHKKGQQPKEDARRAALWLAFLGSSREARAVSKADLKRFVRERRTGRIQAKQWRTVKGVRTLVPLKLKAKPSDTTIGADIIYVQSVWNWAVDVELLPVSRIAKYAERPKSKNPKRPVATMARYTILREHCEATHPRFRAFMDCVVWLGWRVSAVCALRGRDIDRTAHPNYPHGRIHKIGEEDKEGVDMWVPMPQAVREAVDTIPVLGNAPLFPAARNAKRPWSRFSAREKLHLAEAAAKLPPIDGGDFHPYRRMWATLRKHFPVQDVMAAGGWRDARSVETAYQQADPVTMRDVALFNPMAPAKPAKKAPPKPTAKQAG